MGRGRYMLPKHENHQDVIKMFSWYTVYGIYIYINVYKNIYVYIYIQYMDPMGLICMHQVIQRFLGKAAGET